MNDLPAWVHCVQQLTRALGTWNAHGRLLASRRKMKGCVAVTLLKFTHIVGTPVISRSVDDGIAPPSKILRMQYSALVANTPCSSYMPCHKSESFWSNEQVSAWCGLPGGRMAPAAERSAGLQIPYDSVKTPESGRKHCETCRKRHTMLDEEQHVGGGHNSIHDDSTAAQVRACRAA